MDSSVQKEFVMGKEVGSTQVGQEEKVQGSKIAQIKRLNDSIPSRKENWGQWGTGEVGVEAELNGHIKEVAWMYLE